MMRFKSPGKQILIGISVFTLASLTTLAGPAAASSSVATIKIGSDPTAFAVTSNGATAYVIYSGSKNVTKVNLLRDRVIRTISVGRGLTDLALDPNGKDLYVTSSCSSTNCRNSVYRVDTKSLRVDGRIDVGGGSNNVAFSKSGNFAYITNQYGQGYSSEVLSVVNTGSRGLVSRIPIATFPYDISVSANGMAVYIAGVSKVSDSGVVDDVLQVVNLVSLRTISIHQGNLPPCGLAVNPNGMYVYESFCGAPPNSAQANIAVRVINTSANAITASIHIPGGARGLAANAKGTQLYAAGGIVSGFSVINTDSNSVKKFVKVPVPGGNSVLQVIRTVSYQPQIYAIPFALSGQGVFSVITLSSKT